VTSNRNFNGAKQFDAREGTDRVGRALAISIGDFGGVLVEAPDLEPLPDAAEVVLRVLARRA
jgi:hypothetical protein